MKKLLYIPLDYHIHSETGVFDSMLNGFKTEFDALIFKNLEESIEFNPDYVFMHGNAISIEDCNILKFKR